MRKEVHWIPLSDLKDALQVCLLKKTPPGPSLLKFVLTVVETIRPTRQHYIYHIYHIYIIYQQHVSLNVQSERWQTSLQPETNFLFSPVLPEAKNPFWRLSSETYVDKHVLTWTTQLLCFLSKTQTADADADAAGRLYVLASTKSKKK